MKRHTIKQTMDISIIQDFVLNERNIEKILQHIIKSNEQVSNKSKEEIKKPITKNTQFLLPKFIDTLFWCYYIICNGISALKLYTVMDLKIRWK